MLRRTLLSYQFPYRRWDHSRYQGLLFGSFENTFYFRGADGQPRDDHPDDIPDPFHERITACMGLWDDGERLVLITWHDIVRYPGWTIAVTYWDRSAGWSAARMEADYNFAPLDVDTATRQLSDVRFTPIEVVDPATDFLSTGLIGDPSLYEHPPPLRPYTTSLTQAADGTIWANQAGGVLAITRASLKAQGLVYSWIHEYFEQNPPKPPSWASTVFGAQHQVGDYELTVVDPTIFDDFTPDNPLTPEDESGAVPRSEAKNQAAIARIAQMGEEGYRRAAVNYSRFIAPLTPSLMKTTQDVTVAYPATYVPNVVHFDPGDTAHPSSILYADIGVVEVSAFLVLSWSEVLLGNPTPRAGSGHPAGFNVVYALSREGTRRGLAILPQRPIALAYEEGDRAWALCADGTVVSFDYVTGEPFSYCWLPLPFSLVEGSVTTKMAWQRSYRRLIFFPVLTSNDPSAVRNHWASRLVGYSMTPLPVHVCRPIPLRPVRAGRQTPFLVRQVGSLGEPLPGIMTITPGAGVTVDRATVPLDDSGEAHVMVTASAAGDATLTASIQVDATWDHPEVPVPFNDNGTWVEGLV